MTNYVCNTTSKRNICYSQLVEDKKIAPDYYAREREAKKRINAIHFVNSAKEYKTGTVAALKMYSLHWHYK